MCRLFVRAFVRSFVREWEVFNECYLRGPGDLGVDGVSCRPKGWRRKVEKEKGRGIWVGFLGGERYLIVEGRGEERREDESRG